MIQEIKASRSPARFLLYSILDVACDEFIWK